MNKKCYAVEVNKIQYMVPSQSLRVGIRNFINKDDYREMDW